MEAKQIITDITKKLEDKGGIKEVIFVACGGSQAAIYPGYFLLKSETKKLSTSIVNSNEFVHSTPKSVDERTVCIICSLNATAETVEAVKVANAIGAVTIAMTGSPTTEMAKNGQYTLVYSNGDNQVYSDSNQSNVLRLGFEILNQTDGYAHYDEAMAAYGKIDQMVSDAKVNLLPKMQSFAKKFKDDTMFTVLASGSMYGTAYTMACCHLMEMQQKYAITMHSGEYVHGPFETVDENSAIILLKNVGRNRALDNRIEVFLDKYAKHFEVIDAEEVGVQDLGENVAEYFASAVMIPIERYYVYQMSLLTGYDMDNRLYMYKVEY